MKAATKEKAEPIRLIVEPRFLCALLRQENLACSQTDPRLRLRNGTHQKAVFLLL
jgi:hypothetical protein